MYSFFFFFVILNKFISVIVFFKLFFVPTIVFMSKYVYFFRIAGHPLAQNERCLHIFLQEPVIDKSYVPGKIRNT